jgi:hypothetical protein
VPASSPCNLKIPIIDPHNGQQYKERQGAKGKCMANNHSFPILTNFPAQHRQPGHWAAYLLGARKTPPPPTQQELNFAQANRLLDSRQFHQEEGESDSDDDNIDPQLRIQNQPNVAQDLQPPLQTQAVPAPGQCS